MVAAAQMAKTKTAMVSGRRSTITIISMHRLTSSDVPTADMRKALPKDTKRETVRDSARGLKTFVSPQQTVFVPAYRIGK